MTTAPLSTRPRPMAQRWRDMLTDKDEELQKSNRRHYRRDKVRTKDVLSEYYAGEFN